MGWSWARQMHVMLDMKMQLLFFSQTSSWTHWTLHGPGIKWSNPLLLTPQNFFLTYAPLLLFSRHAGPVALSPALQAHVCPRIYEPAVISIWTVLANLYMARSLTSFRSLLKYHINSLNISHRSSAPRSPIPLYFFFVLPTHLPSIFLSYLWPQLEHKIHIGGDLLVLFLELYPVY